MKKDHYISLRSELKKPEHSTDADAVTVAKLNAEIPQEMKGNFVTSLDFLKALGEADFNLVFANLEQSTSIAVQHLLHFIKTTGVDLSEAYVLSLLNLTPAQTLKLAPLHTSTTTKAAQLGWTKGVSAEDIKHARNT